MVALISSSAAIKLSPTLLRFNASETDSRHTRGRSRSNYMTLAGSPRPWNNWVMFSASFLTCCLYLEDGLWVVLLNVPPNLG